mgnify:CR=1 FL=1
MLFIMFLVLIGLVYAALLVTYLLEHRDRKKSAQRLAPLKRKKKNYSKQLRIMIASGILI